MKASYLRIVDFQRIYSYVEYQILFLSHLVQLLHFSIFNPDQSFENSYKTFFPKRDPQFFYSFTCKALKQHGAKSF